jgi:hypothetical protein
MNMEYIRAMGHSMKIPNVPITKKGIQAPNLYDLKLPLIFLIKSMDTEDGSSTFKPPKVTICCPLCNVSAGYIWPAVRS